MRGYAYISSIALHLLIDEQLKKIQFTVIIAIWKILVLFLFKFGINIRKTIRLIESTDMKLINAELALLFNETCKNENILPRYTDIYV